MDSKTTIGDRLKRARREQGITQEELAERSGLSRELITKIESGKRQSVRLTSLTSLAQALDLPLSELADNRPRLDKDRDSASILAIRDALLSPSLLPGIDSDDEDQPASLPDLNAAVDRAASAYWQGALVPLAAMMPGLIGEARSTWHSAGAPAVTPLARTYDLTAALMVHMGKEDLAAIAAERAVTAAASGDDEILYACMRGTYAWVLLHQGRLSEAETLAASAADAIEPAFSAPAHNVAAWGSLQLTALAPAAAAGRDVTRYITLASSGAERLGGQVKIYNTTFAPANVAMQAVHAYAVLREPAKAMQAARKVNAEQLPGTIAQGRHLLDVAQAQVDARHGRDATITLDRAHMMAPVWFRHQGVARSLVLELCEQQRRLTSPLRQLATAVDPDWYAPYHRPGN